MRGCVSRFVRLGDGVSVRSFVREWFFCIQSYGRSHAADAEHAYVTVVIDEVCGW